MPSALGAILSTVEDKVSTTDATETTLATVPVEADSVIILTAFVKGRRTNGADRGGFIRRAVVFRSGAGAATLEGSVNSPFTRFSDSNWDVTIDVDGGNNARIRVTGVAAQNIDWTSKHFITAEK